MKIPININIITEKIQNAFNEHDEVEVIESKAFGFMRKTKKGLQLEYMEDEESGFDGTITTISMLDNEMISVNRQGVLNSHMIFQKGKSHNCVYDNGIIPMELRISTKELKNNISTLGGKLDIHYTIEIIGGYSEKNRLTLSVAPHESIITS
ncbi:DUF1934 domain-containing protein [Eubacteriales bacterium OttesenSCG-928-G02]|nr:DUF1934 domain-containing protein [Eubacteriales bacterium OttesenSCG-928-G02]